MHAVFGTRAPFVSLSFSQNKVCKILCYRIIDEVIPSFFVFFFRALFSDLHIFLQFHSRSRAAIVYTLSRLTRNNKNARQKMKCVLACVHFYAKTYLYDIKKVLAGTHCRNRAKSHSFTNSHSNVCEVNRPRSAVRSPDSRVKIKFILV